MLDLPPAEWSYELTVATGEVSKGSDKTDGDPFARVRGEAAFGPVFVGALAQNVDLDDGSDAELHLLVGWRGELAGVEVEASAAREFYPGIRDEVEDRGEWEFALKASREVGRFGMNLTAEYSPDSVGESGQSLWVEAELEADLGGRMSGSVALGARERSGAEDYAAWNAGLTYALTERVSADLRWYDNDRREPGDRSADLTVLSLTAAW